MPHSFQQTRLAEHLQLCLSQQQTNAETLESASSESRDNSDGSSIFDDTNTSYDRESVDASEEARVILALSNEAGEANLPFAPMMSYEKYVTMQEKRVKVTIRYSAEAGLRPFYLTLANQIKNAYPDVLLEKRILAPVGSDSGGDEAIFEVVVDGKTTIGKKKTKMLKVASTSSRNNDDDTGEESNESNSQSSGDTNEPNIAGGRSIFVSIEKLEQEIIKARKRRRPSTMYKSKEDALRGAAAGNDGGIAAGEGALPKEGRNMQTPGMTEAVMRLERLKAMSRSSASRKLQ